MVLRCLILICLSTCALAEDVRFGEYSYLASGQLSGSQSTATDSNGTIRVSFEFNDRGRGPSLSAVIKIDDAGIPVSLRVTGVNYFKGQVDEQFNVDGSTAIWKTSAESGQTEQFKDEFYLPFSFLPETSAILARALLKSEKRQLDLLPVGTARIELLDDARLESESQSTHISLYGIHDLDLEPMFVWLDDKQELFGVDYGWSAIVRAGWESSIDVMKEKQNKATNSHYEKLAAALTTELSGLTIIKGARIFDSVEGVITGPATVFVWDGIITAVYFDDVDIPGNAIVIDADGKTLMPALWDMHGHIDTKAYINYLAAGVTNVRDMGNDPDEIYRLTNAVRAGIIAGPDVYALGFIDKRSEYSAPIGMLADSLDDAIGFVDYYAQHGFHGIKLYSSIEPSWVKPIVDHSHARGLPVMGHIPAFMSAEQAIKAGYDEITHINMLLLNFLGAEDLDTRTPTRFLVPGEHAGELDLTSPEVGRLIAMMRSRGVAHDPTISIFQSMFRNKPGEVSPLFADIVEHFPAIYQRYLVAENGFNFGKEEEFLRSAEKSMELVALLHRNGVRILPGTDYGLPGFTLIRELIYYVEAGIPSNEALQLATIGPARHLSVDQQLGSVTVGKDAHLVIIDGDPVEDISSLFRVNHVIKGRRMYFAPDLLAAQGFVPF